MRTLFFTAFMILISSAFALAQDTNQVVSLEKQLVHTREIQSKLNNLQEEIEGLDYAKQQESRRSLAINLLKDYQDFSTPKTALPVDFLRYYRAYLQATAGQTGEARQNLLALLDSKVIAPETISALIEIDPGVSQLNVEGFERRLRYFESLALALPVSVGGSFADGHKTQLTRMVEDLPIIPFVHSGRMDSNLVGVARLFFEMKMYDEAQIRYVEAIYATFPPIMGIRGWYWESWLSRASAPLWLKAAEAEMQSSRREEVIANYIAKAVVFGSDDTKDEALKVLDAWRENGAPKTPPVAEPDADKLKQIARLYAQMNMHPRAIEIMKEFAPVIGPEAVTLQGQYEQEWLKLVAQYCVGTVPGQCVLFGQDVSQPENRLKVRIPPPLRPEALAEAAKTVQTLVEAKTEKQNRAP